MFQLWLFVLVLCIYVKCQDPAVILPQGRIVGIKVYPKNSITPVEIFYGVPYATPPIGRYRFSAPERHPGWRRTFFAHRIPPRCPQLGDSENDSISEDCLFLNIWTPRRADTKSTLPVVVILYSESWSEGGVTTLPCEELATEGVVVVTVAYRLHFLAFFTLRSIQARGNLALLDQYLALLWVRENIAPFGGDPTSVTLMGHSAGADSALYHIASQRSVGLFQRAVIMSPRYIWRGIEDDESSSTEVENHSRVMARELRCATGSDENIVLCLRSRSLPEILSIYRSSNWSRVMQPIPDIFLPESEQYLAKSLASALSARQPTAQLDLLMGTADLEAINFNHEDYEELSRQSSQATMDYAMRKLIPQIFETLLPNTQPTPMLTEAVLWEFWGGSPRGGGSSREGLRSSEGLARAETSARWGASAALLAATFARRFSRLYVYTYTRPGVDLRGRLFNYSGAVHGTDLVTLLGDAMLLQVCRRPANAAEQSMTAILRTHFVNFIKYGSPAPESEWPRYRAGGAYVHKMADDACERSEHIGDRHVAFWLQHLPRLAGLAASPERTGTEQLYSNAGEDRLRGGVFALCGVSSLLLVLLCACAALLRAQRRRRAAHSYDTN